MKAAELHAAWRDLPPSKPRAVVGSRPILVLSPHPDDETLGLGGAIAATRDADIPVHIVVISDGSKSHPNSLSYPRKRLVALHRAEVERAGSLLGLSHTDVTYLDLPDASVPTKGTTFDLAVARIAAIADGADIGSVFVTIGGDPHCDHEATWFMAKALRRLRPSLKSWCYPIWGWHLDGAEESSYRPHVASAST